MLHITGAGNMASYPFGHVPTRGTSCADLRKRLRRFPERVIEGPRTAPSGRARRCPCVFERPSVCTRSWRRFEDRTRERSEMHMS